MTNRDHQLDKKKALTTFPHPWRLKQSCVVAAKFDIWWVWRVINVDHRRWAPLTNPMAFGVVRLPLPYACALCRTQIRYRFDRCTCKHIFNAIKPPLLPACWHAPTTQPGATVPTACAFAGELSRVDSMRSGSCGATFIFARLPSRSQRFATVDGSAGDKLIINTPHTYTHIPKKQPLPLP